MIKARVSIFLVALSVLSALLANAQAKSLPDGVFVAIEPLKSEYRKEDQVLVKLTYTNKSEEGARLLKWETGLNGRLDEDILAIFLDGEELDYRGRIYKRALPTVSDYITLRPNQSTSKVVDLQLSYPVEFKGEYRLIWREHYDRAANAAAQKKRVVDNSVVFSLAQDIPLPALFRTGRLPSTFQNCSGFQANEISASVAVAESYARIARDSLSQTPIDQQVNARRYNEWFGVYNPARWAAVQGNFNQIYSAISGRTLGFDCGCTESSFAFVYPNDPYNMTLCNAFWSAGRTGTDSKAGTIIHEVSHFIIVADTDDHAYGQSNCRALANSDL